jgi:hypothetical protein
MRHIPLYAALLGAGGIFLSSLADAQTYSSAHVPIREVGHYQIVQVRLNDTGPYNFVFDTGTNSTLVKRALLERLSIPLYGKVEFNSTTSSGFRERAILDEVSVGGAKVRHVEIMSLDSRDLAGLGKDVMGVLGENFLKHFDLLIENRRHTLTLDRTSALSDAVQGEHLSISRFGHVQSEWTADRLVVELRIPYVAKQKLQFVVDSGVNEVILFKAPGMVGPISLSGGSVRLHGMMSGSRSCVVQPMTVELGSTQMRRVNVTECPGSTRSRTDVDGSLPTRAFRRLFVSYREGYIIVNPSVRKERVSALVQIAGVIDPILNPVETPPALRLAERARSSSCAFKLQHQFFPLGGEGTELCTKAGGEISEALRFSGGDVDTELLFGMRD